ncbi:cytochrome P450 [Aquamicrobium soli]|uniref:Cytochrome P450 n=1 Tax=Aquamicrobium soli TaxID=1811518 RepID=A0ABV7K8R1_9HYPH
MKHPVQFKTMPASLESFGVAVDFLSRREPFVADQVGPFIRAVRRQILRREHVVGFDGATLVGYAGWLPTTRAAADAWLENGGELHSADHGADAVALTIVAVDDPRVTLGLMRAARELNPGLRVFFKRSYADATREARKSAVMNRTGLTPDQSVENRPAPPAAAPARSGARPPIADDPCAFLYALAERSPGATERVAIGEEQVLVVQDPQVAAHVLVDNLANYSKNFSSFTPFFGRSRLTLDGDAWRRSQRISQGFIAPHDTARATEIFSRLYAGLAEELASRGGAAGPVDGALDRAAVAALTETAFSTPLAELGDGFAADLRPIIHYTARRAWDLPGVPPAVNETMLAEAQAAAGRVRKAIARMVERRRRVEPRDNDALSALIAAADRTECEPEEIRIDLAGELVTLVVAGSDTTSAALGWALSILAAFPAFQNALRDEIFAAFGHGGPTLENLERVPNLRPFIDETLRMFPPVAILSRFANGSDTVGGHAVAAGDRVLVSVIGLHQNPANWDAPREFLIERHHAEQRARGERRSRFMAFSAGPRICGGARFARMEMEIALAQILRTCRLELAEPLPLAFDWGASMRRRGGQKIKVTRL